MKRTRDISMSSYRRGEARNKLHCPQGGERVSRSNPAEVIHLTAYARGLPPYDTHIKLLPTL
jgi:hypothetical protein